MRTSPVEASGRLKVVTGTVNSDGTILTGYGFTVLRSAAGVYQLRFFNLFANATKLNITVTSLYAGGFTATIAGSGVPADGPIQVQTYNPSVVIADSPFGFVISGILKQNL